MKGDDRFIWFHFDSSYFFRSLLVHHIYGAQKHFLVVLGVGGMGGARAEHASPSQQRAVTKHASGTGRQ